MLVYSRGTLVQCDDFLSRMTGLPLVQQKRANGLRERA